MSQYSDEIIECHAKSAAQPLGITQNYTIHLHSKYACQKFHDSMIQPESMYVYGGRAKLDTHTDSRSPFDLQSSDPDAMLSPVATYDIRREGWIE